MLSSRFLWQIWATIGGIVAVNTLVFGFIMTTQLSADARNTIHNSLHRQLTILRPMFIPYLRAGQTINGSTLDELTLGLESRITVIDKDGTVLADNRETPAVMDNHARRPEIVGARAHTVGNSERYSSTLARRMMYVALRVQDGDEPLGFIRLAVPIEVIDTQLARLQSRIFMSAAAITVISLLVGLFLARHITRPIVEMTNVAGEIARGRYELRLPINREDEIGELSLALNALASGTEVRIQDLTSSRNELAAILAGLTEGVIAIKPDGQVVHINNAAKTMLRIDPDSPDHKGLRGMGYPSEIVQAVETCLAEQVRLSLSVQVGNATLDVSVAPQGEPDDQRTVGAIVVLQDITEFLHLEKVRSDFVANASHELKTPISAIRGLVETILDDQAMEPDVQDRFLGRIRIQAIRLDNIVQDLIRLSRFDSHQRPAMNTTMVDLGWVLRQVYQSRLDDAADAGVELILELPNEHVTVEGESTALDQMVVNLVDNAIKYSGGEGRVSLRLGRQGAMALIEVEDGGIGIPEEEQQRIFERFYRVDRGRSRQLGGTGLGLSIVKHIARSHHGEVTLTSEIGKGSTFSVRIPLPG